MLNKHQLAFPVYAQTIANGLGVNLKIEGTQASFDGETIILPALDLNDPEIAQAAWGKLYHEGFHARYSNMEIVKQVAAGGTRKRLLNAIEDSMIEALGEQEFLSSRGDLEANMAFNVANGFMHPNTAGDHPAQVFINHVLFRLRHRFNGRAALAENAQAQESSFRDVFPKGVVARVHALLDAQMENVSTTEGSLALTDALLKVLEDEDENQSDDASSSEDSTADGSGEPGADDLAADKPTDGPGDPSQGSAGADDDACDGGKTSGDLSDQDDFPPKPSPMRQVLDAKAADLPDDPERKFEAAMQRSAQKAERYRVARSAPIGLGPKRAIGQSAYDKAMGHSQGARRALQRMFQGEVKQQTRLKDYGQRIDQSRMSRVYSGDFRVFRHIRPARRYSAAVHLLLDASPSMASRLETALESALSMALAIERIPNVSCALTRFPLNHGAAFKDDVQVLLRRGDRVAQSVRHFNIGTCGGTPLTDALWYVMSELWTQPDPRKVIIVVTDGDPNNKSGSRTALEFARRSGIENVGIGIGTMVAETLFDVSRTIQDVSELSGALMSLLKNLARAA